jgi:hypothetical protein
VKLTAIKPIRTVTELETENDNRKSSMRGLK